MAKTSSIVKYRKSIKLIERYKKQIEELKGIIRSQKSTDEERYEAQTKLNKIPRRAHPVQLRLRCELTGRSRGNFRKFRLSRMKFRELAHQGLLPGVSKASW